ncbi:adenylyltransferase/cytidyltransferase family protein [Desulfurella sp.]|uniref:adenylyltransferase/cytidyltransferase family protein n=1 Tax=Desulfurella sp. TaxID=1962857 RepID=UPI003D0CECF6
MAKRKKTVITYGTFDLFHIGHLNLFKRLKELGNYLIVAVSTDEFNQLKGKKAIIPFEQRIEIVRSIRHVDMAIPEVNWEQKLYDVKKYSVDIFAIGEDWKGKFEFLREYCEVVYLPRTKGISSTDIRKLLADFNISKDELIKAFEIIDQLKKNLE